MTCILSLLLIGGPLSLYFVIFMSKYLNVVCQISETRLIPNCLLFSSPGYNDWLKFCGLTYAVNSFNEFVYLSPETRVKFADLYNHVDDVDLFVGAVREIPLPGDIAGPVFTCLNAQQFHRARFGDRFWHQERANGFTLRKFLDMMTLYGLDYLSFFLSSPPPA